MGSPCRLIAVLTLFSLFLFQVALGSRNELDRSSSELLSDSTNDEMPHIDRVSFDHSTAMALLQKSSEDSEDTDASALSAADQAKTNRIRSNSLTTNAILQKTRKAIQVQLAVEEMSKFIKSAIKTRTIDDAYIQDVVDLTQLILEEELEDLSEDGMVNMAQKIASIQSHHLAHRHHFNQLADLAKEGHQLKHYLLKQILNRVKE